MSAIATYQLTEEQTTRLVNAARFYMAVVNQTLVHSCPPGVVPRVFNAALATQIMIVSECVGADQADYFVVRGAVQGIGQVVAQIDDPTQRSFAIGDLMRDLIATSDASAAIHDTVGPMQ